jgi:hypothetical protein
MAVTFQTTKYEASHGKKPRGFGGWMFSPAPNGDARSADTITAWGEYGSAKLEAREKARRRYGRQPVELYVLP